MVDIHVKLCRLVSEKGPFWPKNGIKSNLIAYKFTKFSGGPCPHTPLLLHAYTHTYTCTTNLATPNLITTALPTEARLFDSSTGSSIESHVLPDHQKYSWDCTSIRIMQSLVPQLWSASTLVSSTSIAHHVHNFWCKDLCMGCSQTIESSSSGHTHRQAWSLCCDLHSSTCTLVKHRLLTIYE